MTAGGGRVFCPVICYGKYEKGAWSEKLLNPAGAASKGKTGKFVLPRFRSHGQGKQRGDQCVRLLFYREYSCGFVFVLEAFVCWRSPRGHFVHSCAQERAALREFSVSGHANAPNHACWSEQQHILAVTLIAGAPWSHDSIRDLIPGQGVGGESSRARRGPPGQVARRGRDQPYGERVGGKQLAPGSSECVSSTHFQHR